MLRCCHLILLLYAAGLQSSNNGSLYEAVELFPGASTQSHLFTQHGLCVNGPLFSNPAEGPPNLLLATNAMGQPSVVKMLSAVGSQETEHLGGSEAAAFRCAPLGSLTLNPRCMVPGTTPCTGDYPMHMLTGPCILTVRQLAYRW